MKPPKYVPRDTTQPDICHICGQSARGICHACHKICCFMHREKRKEKLYCKICIDEMKHLEV